MSRKKSTEYLKNCSPKIMAIHDALDILSGKWKISILSTLRHRKMRFMDLQREVDGIGGKMLSKELKDLEVNGNYKVNFIRYKARYR